MWLRRRRCLRLAAVLLCSAALVALLTGATQRRRRPQGGAEGTRSVLVFNEASYMQGEFSDGGGPTKTHAFNIEASARVLSDRDLPDPRHPRCERAEHDISNGATVSVIISFHNEARSALLRTVISVLNRTPEGLLEEVILVDDASTDEQAGSLLVVLPGVKLLRLQWRQGLIRARIRGASTAAGDHLVFLDSHCEVNRRWLEPLLAAVFQEPKAVVSPVLDVIDSQTFEYRSSNPHLRGGFGWSLRRRRLNSSAAIDPDSTSPFTSPVLLGGVFLISREWFDRLGQFDPGLEVWGSEDLELSLKAWTCGGRVLVAPCSRVGHVLRRRHPYTFPEGNVQTSLRNSKRVAEVWMDEYKRFFYQRRPAATGVSCGDISDRRALRRSLQCRSFGWYIDEVYPEIRPPVDDQRAYGQLSQGGRCAAVGAGGSLTLG
ncbi:polypeptide N-acetylgalactosaminyltransferase 16-like, partial [Pollicipes pollicipes]|uniref:polypeptide N-acetylgalactosaminyltransferase 16-like n=1 Tax=Pollicipes pollicipes TaxID=41117 RepID=UPI0018851180